jgi:hypothetical protein
VEPVTEEGDAGLSSEFLAMGLKMGKQGHIYL